MSNPTKAQNRWQNEGGEDFLSLISKTSGLLGGIDSTGSLYGNLVPPMPSVISSVPGIINPANMPYNAKFDARWTADGVLTNNSPVVTSAMIVFTQADVGKKIYTVNSSTYATHLNSTILSVESATSCTANAKASAAETGSALCVGTDDTVALQSAWLDALSQNKLLVLPSGKTIATGVLFSADAANYPPGTNFSVLGQGPGTVIILAPDFNPTVSGYGAVWGLVTDIFAFPDQIRPWPQVGNFTVTGLSSSFSGMFSNRSMFSTSSAGGAVYQNINVFGIRGGWANVFTLNIEDKLYNPNLQQMGQVEPVLVRGSNVDIFSPIIAYTDGRGIRFYDVDNVNIHGGITVGCGGNPGDSPHAGISSQGQQNYKFHHLLLSY